MTQPVQRLPNSLYFVTASCERHEFRLRPDKETVGAFSSLLKMTSDKFHIDLIAVCQMSSHYHALVYDHDGLLSLFLKEFHSGMAKYANRKEKKQGQRFWSNTGPEVIRVHESDSDAIIHIMAYIMANPVKDLVVHKPSKWKGLCTKTNEIGSISNSAFLRPKAYFGKKSLAPESGHIMYKMPDCILKHISLEALRKGVDKRVQDYVKMAANKMSAHRIKQIEAEEEVFLPTSTIRFSKGDQGTSSQTRRRKRVTASNPETAKLLLEELKVFTSAYIEACEKRKNGEDAIFPPGTWWRYYKLGEKRYNQKGGVEIYASNSAA